MHRMHRHCLTTARTARIVRFFSGSLSAEHAAVRDVCREFAKRELVPIAGRLDAEATYPRRQIEKLAEMGFMNMCVRPGYDTLGMAVAVEELSRGCAATGAIVSIHNCLFANLVNRLGTPAQKEKHLNSSIEVPGCFALSEPNAGSNVIQLETSAVMDGDHWIINGTKSWVTSAPQGKAFIVFAVTDRSKKHKGITAFIIDRAVPGIVLGPKDDLLGIRALSCCTVQFDSVRIGSECILGNVGDGFKIAMSQLDQARIGISAQALGIAQAALDCAVNYSIERKVSTGTLSLLPSIQTRLAEMATCLEGSRLLTWKAAVEYDSGVRSTKHSSIAKLAASDCANFAVDNCIQILGAMGLSKSFPAERLYRDARVTKIYGGVTDVQKMIIAQQVISEYVKDAQNL